MNSDPIKVMRIIARLNIGGPAVHCLSLSEKLTAHGFRTILVTGTPAQGEADYETTFGVLARNFKMVRLHRLSRAIHGLSDFITFWQLFWLMCREQPRIVHTHTAKAGMLGRTAAILARVPIIVHTFHGHVLRDYFGPIFSRFIQAVERSLAKHTTAIVTLAPSLRHELSTQFRIAPVDQIRVVPLGRNLTPFLQSKSGTLKQELGIGNEVKLFGSVGRLVPIKDYEMLLQACSLLPRQIPWRCLLIGDGPLKEDLKDLAARLELSSQISFLGWRLDLPAIYADLECFVLSSLNEGTPLSIIESFASGCPVVATAVGGVPDMFGNTKNVITDENISIRQEGALVPAQNPRALAKAIELFLTTPKLREECRQAARLKALEYSEDVLAERIGKLYWDLLAKEASCRECSEANFLKIPGVVE